MPCPLKGRFGDLEKARVRTFKLPLPILDLCLKQICVVTCTQLNKFQTAWKGKKKLYNEHSQAFKNSTATCSCAKIDLSNFSCCLQEMAIKS